LEKEKERIFRKWCNRQCRETNIDWADDTICAVVRASFDLGWEQRMALWVEELRDFEKMPRRRWLAKWRDHKRKELFDKWWGEKVDKMSGTDYYRQSLKFHPPFSIFEAFIAGWEKRWEGEMSDLRTFIDKKLEE